MPPSTGVDATRHQPMSVEATFEATFGAKVGIEWKLGGDGAAVLVGAVRAGSAAEADDRLRPDLQLTRIGRAPVEAGGLSLEKVRNAVKSAARPVTLGFEERAEIKPMSPSALMASALFLRFWFRIRFKQ